MADLKQVSEMLIKGKVNDVKALVEKAVAEGVSAEEILKNGLIAGMNVVGAKFKANEFYIPEVLIAARAMHGGMAILKPLLAKSNMKSPGRIIIGTVKGDLHDIGKNLVAMMLEGAGFEVIDLGIDVPVQKFVDTCKAQKVDVVALSALLTTTMPMMKDTIAEMKKNLTNLPKIMVGGAPVTQNFATEIGADGFAPDAASAVDTAKELIGIN
ncbi:MAG: corrinoid protein [Elusimicrobiota bacterium]